MATPASVFRPSALRTDQIHYRYSMRHRPLYRWVFNLHLLVSLALGLFISIVSVTGAILGFEPEIDRLLHRDISYVVPEGRVLTLRQLQDRVTAAYPDEPVVAMMPALADDLSWQVALPSGIAYVDPYTGEILGIRERGESFLGTVRSLHVGLVGGAIGAFLVKWSTVAAVPLLVSGIVLWWPQKRFRFSGSFRRRRSWLDAHNSLGAAAGLFLLMLAATGSAMAFSDSMRPHLYRIFGEDPPPEAPRYTADFSEPFRVSSDQALNIATEAVPRAKPYRIQFPEFGGTFVVTLNDPADRILGERHSVVIDPHSGAILLHRNPNYIHGVNRILAAINKAHTGSLLGIFGKFLVCVASLLTLAIFVSGIGMMWFRSLKPGRPLLR